MSRTLLVVFNTCGLGGHDHSESYVASVESILRQDLDGFRVLLSDCGSPPHIRARLRERLGGRVSYSFFEDVLPVFVTFNWSVFHALKRFGNFRAFLYVDSGVTLGQYSQVLSRLFNRFREDESRTGMVAVSVDRDNSSYEYLRRPEPFKIGVVLIGEHVNLHCLLIGDRLRRRYYGRCLPDVFKGCGSEGTYPYLCSALRMKFLLTTDTPRISHVPSFDGPNAGFPDGLRYGLLHKDVSVYDIARKGAPYGFGFEEWISANHPGDRGKFDQDGLARDEGLFRFLRKHLFVRPGVLRYAKVRATFVE